MPPITLPKTPIHLGLGGHALVQPEMTGMAWYEAYGARTAADGVDGRLVSMHTFHKPWDSWEMHPQGDEVVVCTAGTLVLTQEIDGQHRSVTLCPGEAAVNPAGVWHTADVEGSATALFITAGIGTEHRPRR